MAEQADPELRESPRIRQFASYFQNYMGASTIVVAALPVPAAYLRLIPMHEPDRGSTSVITSLVCFLLLAFIFYSRHRLAKIFFPDVAPAAAWGGEPLGWVARLRRMNMSGARRLALSSTILLLISGAVVLFLLYELTWMSLLSQPAPIARLKLMAYYLGFFACAEAAFVLMATKEYLQELLGLSDNDLIRGRLRAVGAATSIGRRRRARGADVPARPAAVEVAAGDTGPPDGAIAT